MSKLKAYTITDKYVVVNFDGKSHYVPRTEALADKLIAALRDGREDEIPSMIEVAKRIDKFSGGNFQVRDGKIFVNGVEAPKVLGDKIVDFSNKGLPYKPLVKFAENLQKNPSFRAVQELFVFLEKNQHPITEEGNFLAYKRVRGSFKDIHSNTMDNSPGTVVEMPRNQVNEDSNVTCSHGLHVANWDYAHNHFASSDRDTDVMLEVEVNPADVVSIPVDYNNAKIRVCKYKVLGLVDQEHSSDTSLRVTNPDYSPKADLDSYDDEEEEDEESEDLENECKECGDSIEPGYDYCDDCEEEIYDREAEEDEYDDEDEEDDEDDDDYPWESELDD